MIVEVKNLNFEYTDKKALDNVSFEINEGAITALVGPNGAGKTTLLRCLAALSKPRSGLISINGINAIDDPRGVHTQVGYLSDFFGLYEQLTVEQSLLFTAHSRLSPTEDIQSAIQKAIERSGISTFIEKKISTLSRGMRQRVGIAQAIMHEPRLLLLDEPASGLDPEARHSLSSLLTELRSSGMVIMVSSHILAELEDYSTEMLVISEGRIIEHKVLGQVLSNLRSMLVKFATESASFAGILSQWPGISEVNTEGNNLHLQLNENVLTKSDLLKKLMMNNLPVEEVTESKMDLQEEYIKTVNAYKGKN